MIYKLWDSESHKFTEISLKRQLQFEDVYIGIKSWETCPTKSEYSISIGEYYKMVNADFAKVSLNQ